MSPTENGGAHLRWQSPEGLLYTAKRAAKKALRYKREAPKFLIDDIAQDIICAFLGAAESERPKTLEEFEVFSLNIARNAGASRNYRQKDELRGEVDIRDRHGRTSSKYLVDVVAEHGESYFGLYLTYHKATQILHMEALDALRMISRLPARDRALVESLFDYVDVVEYARDMKLSPFDAMKEIKLARERLRAVADINDEVFVEQQNRIAANAWKKKPADTIMEIMETGKAPRSLHGLNIMFDWTGEPPYEDFRFRKAAKLAWQKQVGKTCPICHHGMIFIAGSGSGGLNPYMATVDHIRARALGGTNALKNLWITCYACNQEKSRYERREVRELKRRYCVAIA